MMQAGLQLDAANQNNAERLSEMRSWISKELTSGQ